MKLPQVLISVSLASEMSPKNSDNAAFVMNITVYDLGTGRQESNLLCSSAFHPGWRPALQEDVTWLLSV
jgi:hypothetical protein